MKTSLNLEPSKTAYVVIDMQEGILATPGLVPHSSDALLKRANQLAFACHEQDALVVLVNVEIASFNYLQPITDQEPRRFTKVPASYAKLSLDIAARQQDNVLTVTKHNPGAFFGTDLDLQLRRRGIDTIVLSGVATANGVYATALDAYQLGYNLILAEDACADRDLEVHQLFLKKLFPRFARLRTTAEILHALQD